MPFQVSYSSKTQILSAVRLLSAGSDQIQICVNLIFLHAEIVGDLAGHRLQWVQIGGSGVTINDADKVDAWFTDDNNSDKTFRFYLDRNTPFEQYKDVTIFRTPTSFFLGSNEGNQTQKLFNRYLQASPVACANITGTVVVTAPPPTTSHGEEPSSAIEVVITWQHPGDSLKDQYITQYIVYQDDVDVFRLPLIPLGPPLTGNGPPTGPLQYRTTQRARYKIKTKYFINGFPLEYDSCEKDYTGLVFPNVRVYNDTFHSPSISSSQRYFTRKDYTFEANKESVDYFMSSVSESQRYFTRKDYTFEANKESVDYVLFSSMGSQQTMQTINIVRYDPQGIGG